jgi:transcriptional regulator GlxA family with amidase domain
MQNGLSSFAFLHQWHRDGQLPYASMIANVKHGDAVILRCQTWLGENYERPDVIAAVVSYSGLPKRTFDRRFRAATGYAPLAYVQALRIEEAKHLLETGSMPVDAIAAEVGYEDTASFRRLFQRIAGVPPGGYRRKFQLPDIVTKAARPSQPQRKPNALPRRNADSGARSAQRLSQRRRNRQTRAGTSASPRSQ